MSDHVVDAELVEERIVLCPLCHQKNRLYQNRDKGVYQCGACRATLPDPFARRSKPAISAKDILFYLVTPVLALLVAMAIVGWIFFHPRSPAELALARKAAERDALIDKLLSEIGPAIISAQPTPTETGPRPDPGSAASSPASAPDDSKRTLALQKGDAPSVASELDPDESQTSTPGVINVLPTVLPMNNEILFDALPDGAFKGELTVENGTSHLAVAKLIDLKTDQKILSFAVGARQKSTIYSIPDGNYQLVFAFGDRLFEGTDRFSTPQGFSKFVRLITFNTKSKDEAVYRDRLSVTLHPALTGNTRTASIPQKEFESY